MATIEQMGRGRTLNVTGAVGVAGLNELLRDFKKLDKEINKTIRRVNKSIADEVSNDAIKLGKQQLIINTTSVGFYWGFNEYQL